jgi:hypothetical protein
VLNKGGEEWGGERGAERELEGRGRSGDMEKEEGAWKATVSDRGPRNGQMSRWLD